MKQLLVFSALAGGLALAQPALAHTTNSFRETDLVSDVPGRAANLDPLLANPWGIVIDSHGQIRVANNHSGTSTVYSRAGIAASPTFILPPAGSASPTGMVANGTSGFAISKNGHTAASRYLFVSEDGTISGWNPDVDPDTAVAAATIDTAIYKGLAIASTASGNRLFAANFHAGTVDVFDTHFAPVSLPSGAFVDPGLPEGYAPFNIVNLRGRLYISYAKQDADREDDAPGDGFGFVDVYDYQGHLVRRLISQGPLTAPWGMIIAPDGFGSFGGALLVGNFGNGWINAFDPSTGDFIASLQDTTGSPIAIEGLWGLVAAGGSRSGGDDGGDDQGDDDSPNSARLGVRPMDGGEDGDDQGDDDQGDGEHHSGASATVYFTAGISGEDHGLLGSLSAPASRRRGDDDGEDHDLRCTIARGNPAHRSDGASVEFNVATLAPTVVRLRIYDVAGRLVAEPLRDVTVNGTMSTMWNVSNKHGERVRAGSYFYRAVGGTHVAKGHLVVVP